MNNNYTIFLTGLSGSGKTTIAIELKKRIRDIVLLDGDILRNGLCEDLTFSDDDRIENMRRLRHICKLFNDNNQNVISAFISPFEEERVLAKNMIDNCYIVYVDSPLEICEKRDVKGLYKKARNKEIKNFTGIDSVYEKPEVCDLVIDTNNLSIKESVDKLLTFISQL